MEKIRAEEKYFRKRIKAELDAMYEENSTFTENLEINLTALQELSQGYLEIFVKIESFGTKFRGEFGDVFEDQTHNINLFTQETRKKIQKIKFSEIEEEKRHKISEEFKKSERKKREKVVLCTNIYDNICDRLSNLELKCANDVEALTDPDLLNEKRELKTLDSEFNHILDRVTKLSEHNPNEYVETLDFLTKAF